MLQTTRNLEKASDGRAHESNLWLLRGFNAFNGSHAATAASNLFEAQCK